MTIPDQNEESQRLLPDTMEETSPLLPTDLPPSILPSKSFRRRVIFSSYLFITLIEAYSFLSASPTQELMEDFICHNYYDDHLMNQPPSIQDVRCKGPEVQETLAMVKSWWMSLEMLIPLFVQIPYGILADKYGRRPVLFLCFFGITLEAFWTILVLRNPAIFSIWAIFYGTLFLSIGGGGSMATAMIWVIVVDTVPVAERTTTFYQITASTLIMNAGFNPLAAWLMSIDPWLPVWIGAICMVLSTLTTLAVPETLALRKKADAIRQGKPTDDGTLLPHQEAADAQDQAIPSYRAVIHKAIASAANDVKHIWHFIVGSKSIMILVVVYGLTYPVRQAFESLMLQYISKRFDWTWSKATYMQTIAKFSAVITLLIILPALSPALARSLGNNPLKRDLYLARGSMVFIVLASLFVTFAYSPAVLVLGFISYGFGNGVLSQIRALATGVVEPHTVATLNTMISSMEAFMGFTGAPVLGWLFGKGIGLGGPWLGLPFIVTTVLSVLISLGLWVFKLPSGYAQAQS